MAAVKDTSRTSASGPPPVPVTAVSDMGKPQKRPPGQQVSCRCPGCHLPTAPTPPQAWDSVPVCVVFLLGQHLLSTYRLPDAGVLWGEQWAGCGWRLLSTAWFLHTGVSLSLLSLCLPAFLPSPTRFLGAQAVAPKGPASSATTHRLCGSPGPGHSACLLSGNCFSCFPSGGSREGRLGRCPAELSVLPAVSGFQGLAALQGPHYLGQLPTCLWPQHLGVSMSCHLSGAFCRDL